MDYCMIEQNEHTWSSSWKWPRLALDNQERNLDVSFSEHSLHLHSPIEIPQEVYEASEVLLLSFYSIQSEEFIDY